MGKSNKKDLQKSIQQLEGGDWGEPTFDSYLVRTVYRLRRKPLNEFTHEDVRIMIGQEVGLDLLIPMAIEILRTDPLASGDFYPGDLLAAVTRVKESFWRNHKEWFREVGTILSKVRDEKPADEVVMTILKEAPAFSSVE